MFSHQYTTAELFNFDLPQPIWNSARFWHICLCKRVNMIHIHIYIQTDRKLASSNGFLFYFMKNQTFDLWTLRNKQSLNPPKYFSFLHIRPVIPKVCSARLVEVVCESLYRVHINILYFADHQIIPSGPHTEKVWEPLH